MNEQKPTASMKMWLGRLAATATGELHWPRPKYDMAGRMRDIGLVEIIDKPGSAGWPYTGWHIRISDAGRAAVSGKKGGS